MNYQRLVKIDEEIENIDKDLYYLNGASCGILSGKIEFETNSQFQCKLNCWIGHKYLFEIVKDFLISELNQKREELKTEKNKLLNFKWYKFWLW